MAACMLQTVVARAHAPPGSSHLRNRGPAGHALQQRPRMLAGWKHVHGSISSICPALPFRRAWRSPGVEPRLPGRLVAASAAHAGSLDGLQPLSSYTPPAHLPTPPDSASVKDLFPYITKLALSQSTLYWRLGVALVLLVGSKAAGLYSPLLFKQAIDALSAGATPTAVQTASMALVLSGAARALSSLTREAQHPIFTPISQAAARRVSFHTFSHVLNLDLHFHLNRKTGSLSRMLERGSRSIAVIFRAIAFTAIPTLLELAAVCTILARTFDARVSALVLTTFAAYAGWTIAIARWTTQIRREVKDLDNHISGKAVDALLNYETVALYGNEQGEVEQYDQGLIQYQKKSVKMEGVSALLNAGQAFVLAAGMAAVLLVTVRSKPGVTAGDLVMVQGLLLQVWSPLSFLGWFYRELRQSLVDLEDMLRLLKTDNSVVDGSHALPTAAASVADGSAPARRGATRQQASQGLAVHLQNVTYGYPGTTRNVLKGVSLSAAPGESIAIVGPSGSGKSTILRLLVRLFDAGSGAVFVNGVDVRELRKKDLRGAVGVIPQDTVLFNDTLRHNVAYSRPSATFEELEKAAKAAKLDAVVARLSKGWESLVGERGLKLSGGEKQRVAIARAFLREPKLIVCDEATSALDTATEKSIMGSLRELAAGRTSVFVAHRLSTVQACDRIYVLRDGIVAEQGSHPQLLAKGGLYREMWRLQEAEQVFVLRAGMEVSGDCTFAASY
uniref:ABC transporter B family member 25, mitochondrial n=1 Tax=Auxenochlorella protothecoides TaxID=3075 RepID=A0A1D2ABS2_AUXPR